MYLWHNNGDPEVGHITFDGSPARPDGIIIRQAVRQVQGWVQSFASHILHTDLIVGLLRQNDMHAGAKPERIRVKITFNKCHEYKKPLS